MGTDLPLVRRVSKEFTTICLRTPPQKKKKKKRSVIAYKGNIGIVILHAFEVLKS